MKNSKIEWTHHTFNPWIGCEKVSEGCLNCYAKKLVERWGKDFSKRRRTSEAYWKQPLRWEKQYLEDLNDWNAHYGLHGGYPTYPQPQRPRVFCGSLCDIFDDEVPIDWLCQLFNLIFKTPNISWILLTKRPDNIKKRIGTIINPKSDALPEVDCYFELNKFYDGHAPLSNVWLGVTVENQKTADERIPILVQIPAKVRFLSCEPFLSNLHITQYLNSPFAQGQNCYGDPSRHKKPINWVICGGESGANARPMHPDWARSLRDQCQAAGVPFFFKQWGEWSEWDFHNWNPSNYRTNYFAADNGLIPVHRVGKKIAGRLLDNREWNEVPEVNL